MAAVLWLLLLLTAAVSLPTIEGGQADCPSTGLTECSSHQVAEFLRDLKKGYTNSQNELGDMPFDVSVLHEYFAQDGFSTFQVEVSAKDPSAHILAFLLQICTHEGKTASKFVHNSDTEKWMITSCSQPYDTIFQRLVMAQHSIPVAVHSSHSTISLRYLIMDDKMQVHENTLTTSLPKVKSISYDDQGVGLLQRRKRVSTAEPTSAHLLIANDDYLHQISLDGSRVQTPELASQNSGNIVDIDFHFRQNYIYWTDSGAGKIMRANMDGSMVVPVLERGLMQPDGLAVDWVTNKIYFTDNRLDIVGVFELNSNWFKVLFSAQIVNPRAIIVDPSNGWLYWTDWGNTPKIEKASMDGRNRTTIYAGISVGWLNGLTIDYATQVLYYTDAFGDIIWSINTDGTNSVTLATRTQGLSHPFGITFFNDVLYFSDWNGNTVRSMSKDAYITGEQIVTIFNDTCTVPYGVVAVSEGRQTELPNPCSDSSCSQLCLLSSVDPRGYSCDCRQGYILAADHQSCTANSSTTDYSQSSQGTCAAAGYLTCCVAGDCKGFPATCYCDTNCHIFGDCCQDVLADCNNAASDPFIVYTSQYFIHQMSLPFNTTDTQVRTRTIHSGLSRAADIDFHYMNRHIYWSDTIRREIWRSNFDGSAAIMILDTGDSVPSKLAVDWVSDKIYWVSATSSSVNIFDLLSGNQVTLPIFSSSITDIVLHPSHGEMYISLAGNMPRIMKWSMDGNSGTIFQSTNISSPSALFIDYSLNTVVWADSQLNQVESSRFDGTGRGVLYSEINLYLSRDPLSFVIHSNTLYYVGTFFGMAASRTDSNSRLLNNVGCTTSDGIQVITDTRQPQASNPCATGPCASNEICILSTQPAGYSCSNISSTSPLPLLGTCNAAGITGCCMGDFCRGSPPTCSCDASCQLFQDCCSDVPLCSNSTVSPVPLTTPPITTQAVQIMFEEVPVNRTVNEFDNTTFRCHVNDPSASIAWTFIGQQTNVEIHIGEEGGAEDYAVFTENGVSTLSVFNARCPGNLGVFTCVATNGGEHLETQAWLNVLVIPTVNINASVSPHVIDIHCTARANPRANIIWLKSSPTEATRIISGSRITINHIRDTSSLRITQPTSSDSGVYVCEAENVLSNTPVRRSWPLNITAVNECESQPCQNEGSCEDNENGYICSCLPNFDGNDCEKEVSVYTAPVITRHPEGMSLLLGSSANLSCVATGSPSPSFSWYKDGDLISGEARSYLYISEAQPEDRGEYYCKARNGQGEVDSNPVVITIPGVLQYTAQVQLLINSMDLVNEVVVELVSNELVNTSTEVFSVRISNFTQLESSFEVTLLLSLYTEDSEPSSEQVAIIRDALVSELRFNARVMTAGNIIRIDGCESEVYQGYSWPETYLGSNGTADCPCGSILGQFSGDARRLCTGTFTHGAMWSIDIDTSNCETTLSEVSRQLCDIALGFYTNDTVQASKEVLNITSSTQSLTASHLTIITNVVERLTEAATTNPEVRDNYLLTIDNLQQADADEIVQSQMAMNTTTRILNSLEMFVDNLDLSTVENTTGNITTLTFSTYAVQVQNVDPANFNGQTFLVNLGSVAEAVNITGTINRESFITRDGVAQNRKRRNTAPVTQKDIVESTAAVQLPIAFFNDCSRVDTGNSSVISQRLSYSVFVRDALFLPVNRTINQVGSVVVAVRLRCELVNRTMLSMPVRASFQVAEMDNTENSSCAVYNTDRFGAWDTAGCREVATSDGRLECDCIQLGHFGILLDLNPTFIPPVFSTILSVISYVGLGISTICLLVFIFTYLLSKKLRKNAHGHLLVNMSISLLCLYIVFLVANFSARVPQLCGIVSALLQYFFLVFFGWTTAEAIWLYIKLVKVLGSNTLMSRYALKAGLATWLIPALIVVISGGAGHQYFVHPQFCRPTEWPFYFGYILPFVAAYIFNWIIFILIMISICKHTHNMSILKKKTTTENLRDLKVNFFIAITLAVVLGLGWGLGLVATSSNLVGLTLAFQVIFAIFVGSQGALIFILHGLRNTDFRSYWARFIPALQKKGQSSITTSDKSNTMARYSKGTPKGNSIESVTLSTGPSVPEKLDLSAIKRSSTAQTFVSQGVSVVQSPSTDSMFKAEMYSNPITDVHKAVNIASSAGDQNAPSQDKKIIPAGSDAIDDLGMSTKAKRLYSVIPNKSSVVGTAANAHRDYKEVMPVIGNKGAVARMQQNQSYSLLPLPPESTDDTGYATMKNEEIKPADNEERMTVNTDTQSSHVCSLMIYVNMQTANQCIDDGSQYKEIKRDE